LLEYTDTMSLVLQCLALGMERFKQDVVDALVEEVHPQGIYERSDVPVRRLEGLEQLTGVMYGTVPDRVEMVENGVHFWVDVKEGQKTGFFLDQKENRAAIAPFVKGKTVLTASRTWAVSRFMRGIMARRKSRAWIFPFRLRIRDGKRAPERIGERRPLRRSECV